ncbi:MAG: family 1 glycosylhydrolase [Candidatus Methylacidiphilales bacterium]|nr:family 1 glycosylhydrolase [Candidatus Methylacidiphilales bacterium]
MSPSPVGAGRFLWGVATSGYQSEGGYNGPGQPQNNWAESEERSDVATTGQGPDFWNRYEEDFSRCQAMGLNAFRMGVEWARIQPSPARHRHDPPFFDGEALRAYARRLASAREHGMEPVVTLHHFTHPAWLGTDPWLEEETPALFAHYVRHTVLMLNRILESEHGQPPLRWFITLNEPNMLVLNTYVRRQFPGSIPPSIRTVTLAYDHLLAAHVLAYNVLHDLYAGEGWRAPMVSLNTYSSDLYWNDKVLWDFLALGETNLRPSDWNEYFRNRAAEFDEAVHAADLPMAHTAGWFMGKAFQSLANWFHFLVFDAGEMKAFARALERSARSRLFDYTGIDYYDPFSAHLFRFPSFADLELSHVGWHAWVMEGMMRKWWEWKMLPEGLGFFCRHYAEAYHRPVLIAENGMALRRKADNSPGHRRGDRMTRSLFLQMHVRQVIQLVRAGVPVAGYLHWSLTDNYEWGSFTPRFGLYALDYARASVRLEADHLGDEPSRTYAKLVRQAGF